MFRRNLSLACQLLTKVQNNFQNILEAFRNMGSTGEMETRQNPCLLLELLLQFQLLEMPGMKNLLPKHFPASSRNPTAAGILRWTRILKAIKIFSFPLQGAASKVHLMVPYPSLPSLSGFFHLLSLDIVVCNKSGADLDQNLEVKGKAIV